MLFLFCKWTMPLEQSFLPLFSNSVVRHFFSYFDDVDHYIDQRIPFILEFALVYRRGQTSHRILLHRVSLYLWSDLLSSWLPYACYSWFLHSCGYIAVMEKKWKCILGDWEYRKHPHLLSSKKLILGMGHLFRFPYSCPLKHFGLLVNQWGNFFFLDRLTAQVGCISRCMQGVGAVLGFLIVIPGDRYILLYRRSLHLQTLLSMKEIPWWRLQLSIIFQVSHYHLLDLWALLQEYTSVPLIFDWAWNIFADSIVIVLGKGPKSQHVTSRERCRIMRFLSVL